MLSAIEFDHQPTFNTTKINDEGTDCVLSTELRTAELSVAQSCPELTFCIGLLTPQPPSSFLQFRKIRRHLVRAITLTFSCRERENKRMREAKNLKFLDCQLKYRQLDPRVVRLL